MRIGSVLIGTGSYQPETCLTNQMLEGMVETSDEWIVQRTGIKERRIAIGKSTAEIALPAAQRALEDAGKSPEEVDLIIACTATPDSYTPSLSCVMQDKLGAKNAFAFDVVAACSGFVYATDIADSYIKCGKAKTVLIVCAEVLSRLIDYTDRTTCCIFGDGAAAAVFESREDEVGILSTYMHSDGSKGAALLAKALPVEDPFSESREYPSSDRFLKMDGKEVYRFTAKAVPQAIDEAIKRAGVSISEVDWIVPHQANTRIIDMVIRRYGLDREKVFVNLPYYGNTSSASVPLCLDDMRRQGLLKKGQLAVFVGFGGGLTYGSVLIRV